MITRLFFYIALFASQVVAANGSIFNQLTEQGKYAELRLEFDLNAFEQGITQDEYQEATLSLMEGRKVTDAYTIRVRTRGKFRLKTCEFPPLKFKFKKKDLKARGLQPFNDLKLVTHCSEESELYEDRLFREYLAYKLYNRLSDQSFRVQLVRITYVDKHNNRNRYKRWAFVVEDIEEVAARLGGQPFEGYGITQENMVPGADARVAGFEFLLGNTDWDIASNRNVKFVQLPDSVYIPIPYDFDFSGFVAAPYAVPRNDLGQRTVRQRIYQGELRDPAELKAMSELFFQHRETLLSDIRKFTYLDNNSRLDLQDYVNTFYTDDIGPLFREIVMESQEKEAVSK